MIFGAKFRLFLLFGLLCDVNTNSLEVSVQIPENVEIGGSATLACIFNCDISDIFSVKWYRGSLEFYRYMPKETPPIKVFPFIVGGIEVDINNSNASHVTLRNVSEFLSGQFICEVTTEKNLNTLTANANLYVYDPAVLKKPSIKYEQNEGKVFCSTVKDMKIYRFVKNFSTIFYSDNDKIDSKYVTYDDNNSSVIILDTHLLDWNNIKSRTVHCEVYLPGTTPISSDEILIQNFTGNGIPVTPCLIFISGIFNLTILVYNYLLHV